MRHNCGKTKFNTSHWAIVKPVQKKIYTAMAISAAGSAAGLGAVLMLAQTIHAQLENQPVRGWLTFALMLTIASYLLRGMAFKLSHLAAFALESILRVDLADHLAALPLGTIMIQGSAKLAKVMQEDIRALHVFVADSTPLYARAFAAPVMTVVLLIWLDFRLALVASSILFSGVVVLTFIMRAAPDLSQRFNTARERVNQAVIEFVQAMPVVRTFDGGRLSFGRYEVALTQYLEALVGWYRAQGTPSRVAMLILNPMPTLLALVWAGLYWISKGTLDFTTWLGVLLLGTGMAEAVTPYMALFHLIEKAKISIRRIIEVKSLPVLPVSKNPQVPRDASVRFESVTFHYEERDDAALKQVSFTVPEGSFTALVGMSGAGKSTVARLIPRFWDVCGGRVCVGGIDVRDIDPGVLLKHVAFVFQDNVLFSGTIADNIRLGQDKTSMAQVITAAKAAQAHDFITALPQGYDAPAGERGENLSGGQRQRITIARAILQDRPVLVLDEATAFADAENEKLLMRALDELMRGKTVLMIAHRLSTINHADQILVFADGRLVESGPPDCLRDGAGVFATLWQAYENAQAWRIGGTSSCSNGAGLS